MGTYWCETYVFGSYVLIYWVSSGYTLSIQCSLNAAHISIRWTSCNPNVNKLFSPAETAKYHYFDRICMPLCNLCIDRAVQTLLLLSEHSPRTLDTFLTIQLGSNNRLVFNNSYHSSVIECYCTFSFVGKLEHANALILIIKSVNKKGQVNKIKQIPFPETRHKPKQG